MMEVLTTVEEMREWSMDRRARGERIGFVPTMGALHDGHIALIDTSGISCGATVLSIFVNPTQFNSSDDFGSYPRDLTADLELARRHGVDAVFAPATSSMYPEGFDTRVQPGALAERMEGESRPGHFVGVATVVLKLLNIVAPHSAYFGKKDYQQLAVIRSMARDLDLPVAIVAVETIREPDGLAMSSRNARLGEAERRAAPVLFRALDQGRRTGLDGVRECAAIIDRVERELATEPLCEPDYVAVVDASTLEPLAVIDGPALICAAANFGGVRLIDNIELVGSQG